MNSTISWGSREPRHPQLKARSGNGRMQGLRVAVIGAGTIGSYLTRQIQAGRAGASRVVVVADCIGSSHRLEELARREDTAWSTDVMRIVDHRPDLVIEAAAPQAVR